MRLSVCFPGSPGSIAARPVPASVRMACSVVPPSHLIACILPTEPPIQPGLQDRITKKNSPFGKEDRCICSPVFGRICTFQERGRG